MRLYVTLIELRLLLLLLLLKLQCYDESTGSPVCVYLLLPVYFTVMLLHWQDMTNYPNYPNNIIIDELLKTSQLRGVIACAQLQTVICHCHSFHMYLTNNVLLGVNQGCFSFKTSPAPIVINIT